MPAGARAVGAGRGVMVLARRGTRWREGEGRAEGGVGRGTREREEGARGGGEGGGGEWGLDGWWHEAVEDRINRRPLLRKDEIIKVNYKR